MRKKNYFYLMSKLKIAPVFSVFYDENNLPLESDFNKASFYNKTFQIVFLKDDKNKILNILIKTVQKCKIFYKQSLNNKVCDT